MLTTSAITNTIFGHTDAIGAVCAGAVVAGVTADAGTAAGSDTGLGGS